MKNIKLLALLFCAYGLIGSANAVTINVDLSGASSGTFIDGDGADFAGTFAGQSIVGGTGISGSPTGPLTLTPSNSLSVANWNPGVSPAGNSILPTPGNQGPLSVLLDFAAESITWTMGSAEPPSSIDIDFFDIAGNLVQSITQGLLNGYNVYTFSGFGAFAGFTVYNNTDPAGLRFMNFSYETASVPEAGTLALMGIALLGLGLAARRRSV